MEQVEQKNDNGTKIWSWNKKTGMEQKNDNGTKNRSRHKKMPLEHLEQHVNRSRCQLSIPDPYHPYTLKNRSYAETQNFASPVLLR
jgi:hypothetical protein